MTRDLPVIYQAENTECGLACLAMIAWSHGYEADLRHLRQRYSVSMNGVNLRDLIRISNEIGLAARPMRVELNRLKEVRTPAILHWDMSHYVVLKRVKHNTVVVHDPSGGRKTLTLETTSKHFTGIALEFDRTERFQPARHVERPRFSMLWSRTSGLKRSVLQLFLLSIFIQIFAIAGPLYLQVAVDSAVSAYDQQLLTALAIGFCLLTIFNATTEYIRSYLITSIGQSFVFQIIGNVLRHLLRLKTEYFEKRSIGDITSRIGSVHQLKQALAQDFVTVVIDGAMSFFMLALMFLYDSRLACFVFLTTVMHLLITQAFYPGLHRREERLISAMAIEESFVIESVRAARAVKLFGREAERETRWRNLYSDVVNGTVERDRVRFTVQFSATLTFGLQLAGVGLFGAWLVAAGHMSLGMLFAFVAFRQTFANRSMSLFQQIIGLRMLALHLDRVADIVLSEGESTQSGQRRSVASPKEIVLTDVSFRYSYHEDDVLQGLNLTISEGEFIAITGVSGGGKTTLLKVILGLLPPTAGQVRIDGLGLAQYGLAAWRSACGVVMQDDHLLSGTIADNIAFFDPLVDMNKVESVAKAARIHEDIQKMPMGYLSLIGDMGSALSGGQRQRLLFARALYHEPRVLVLDEGTANLDQKTEREIADVIHSMPITRIVIAHRQELINRADRVYVMCDRKLSRLERAASVVAECARSSVSMSLDSVVRTAEA